MYWVSIYDVMRQINKAIPTPPEPGGPSGKPGHPARFATYRDPEGRFQLGYPPGWELKTTDSGIIVRSKFIASFARVDVLPTKEVTWDAIESTAKKMGGSLNITKQMAGPPRHLRGRLELDGTQFDLKTWAWTTDKESVILATGNVVDASRSTKVEKYEERALAAIWREFRVPAP